MDGIFQVPKQPGIRHRLAGYDTSLSTGPPPLLKARVTMPPIFLGADWILDHHDFTCLLPITSAAAELIDFYEDIAAYAAITDAVPSQCYRMWKGDIMMEVMAPAGYDFHWVLVQGFANWMLDRTRRGYINTYQINFVHRTTGLLLTFSLWVGYSRAAADVST